ncbi:MAG: biopolymer transporter Tol [Bacteroidota bacterium]
MQRALRLISLTYVFVALLPAQGREFLHPELRWRTIETKHFLVHYHEGAEWTARTIASVAESVYTPITTLYRHEPDHKVSIVVRDHDDYSNGAAYFYDNKIEIWAPAMDFEFRGIHPWLQNVVTHELTHIIQIQTAMKLGRHFPALYLQWFGYESERRPDVLYGFPNVLVSYPLSFFLVPSWFAEGVAQYNHPSLSYDYWDSHRDMILRMHMIDGTLLSWEEMAVFGKNSLGNESAYNAGFSLVEYIAATYGVETLEQISRSLSALPRLTIDGAIESVLGRTGEELFSEWKSKKETQYRLVKEKLKSGPLEGSLIESEGFGNSYPAFSPDGLSILYVSNKGEDYFGESAVYRYDIRTGTTQRIIERVRSKLSLSPDGKTVYYSKITADNPHWSRLSDLYRFDLATRTETRLTHGLRAFNPQVSKDGLRLVFSKGSDGTTNIGVSNNDGSNVHQVTQVPAGHQVYTPVWSPDGSEIAFGYSQGHGQVVAMINASGGAIRLVAEGGDCRNPAFSEEGSLVYYSSDRTGIFNLYALDRVTGATKQVTNVLGGAFLPAVNRAGDLVYASYSSSGFKIALLPASAQTLNAVDALHNDTTSVAAAMPFSTDDQGTPVGSESSREYRNTFSSLSLIPFIRVDNYNPKNKGIDIIKPGLYGFSFDMLNKLSLFGGAALNRKLERDLFVIFEFSDKLPILSAIGLEPVLGLELYNISRKTTSTFTIDPSPELVSTEITYNLFEFTASLRQPVFNEKTEARFWYTLGRYGADIGSFINPNASPGDPGALISSFRNVYFIGNSFNAQVKMDYIRLDVDREINPVGRSMLFRYSYETDKFNPEGEFDFSSGLPVPQYQRFVLHRAEVQWNEHMALPWRRHTLTVGLRAAGIIGKTADSFFDSYAGGVLGMKGYPFYALGGNTIGTASFVYRFPLATKLDFRILQFYFTKLYGSVFYDLGNAWTGKVPPLNDWKTDAGFELRLESFSFYAYPTRFFFSGAYGFDQFQKTFSEVQVQYGKEWRFYFGILFGFELGDINSSVTRLLRMW